MRHRTHRMEARHRCRDKAPLIARPTRFAPQPLKTLGAKAQIEAIFKGMTFDSTESFRKPLGITEVTAGSDFGAASHWVPSGVCPFYLRGISHTVA